MFPYTYQYFVLYMLMCSANALHIGHTTKWLLKRTPDQVPGSLPGGTIMTINNAILQHFEDNGHQIDPKAAF